MFVRKLSPKLIAQLMQEKLFTAKLLPDIRKGNVFPAIRDNSIDFYYQGGNLFSYNGRFQTHVKYASVFKFDKLYLFENDLDGVEKITDFADGYERIKENCSLYSGIEASGVSTIYSKNSYVSNLNSKIVVLDIEISVGSSDEERNQNRIDFLLYNLEEKRLRFYEAKHFSNKEIWSRAGLKPRVVEQVMRYTKQIKRLHTEIIGGYQDYVQIVNNIFGLELPIPTQLDEEAVLIIFGFDRDQLKGRFKTLLIDDHSLAGLKYYAIGDESGLILDNVWNKY